MVGLHYFPSFAELYESLIPRVGAVGLGYGEGEVPRPADMLEYYSEDAVRRFGVLGIEITVFKWNEAVKFTAPISYIVDLLLNYLSDYSATMITCLPV